MVQDLTLEELKKIAASARKRGRHGAVRARMDRDPIPWDYDEVVRRYLWPEADVLEAGTGSGERLFTLAQHFGTGVGIDADPALIQTARDSVPPSLREKVSFAVMRPDAFQFLDASFDVVLNQHAPLDVSEVVRVLRPSGFFITERVGAGDTRHICRIFGCDPDGRYRTTPPSGLIALTGAFLDGGCRVVARAEYDVPAYFVDLESLLLWLQSTPMPRDFNLDRHWEQVTQIAADYHTPRGIETNEHRELLIVQKVLIR